MQIRKKNVVNDYLFFRWGHNDSMDLRKTGGRMSDNLFFGRGRAGRERLLTFFFKWKNK